MESTENISPAISFPAGNDDFRAARNDCARACRRFNETPEDADPEIRCKLWLDIVSPNRPSPPPNQATTLDQTFRDPTLVPAAPFVKPPLHMDYGLRVKVGGSTFINRYCMIMDTPVVDVVIGERCNIGPHCAILSVGHPVGVVERTEGRASLGREVRIGDGVWVGARVTIMGGVTIGDGAVIGACSLVTRNIPPRALAYGVPAEVIRILGEEEEDELDAGHKEASVDTLEEALKVSSSSSTAGSSREATPCPQLVDMNKSSSSSGIYHRHPYRGGRGNGGQQHLGGVRDSHGMTRAEIFALVALAMSFSASLFFVAVVLVVKQAAEISWSRERDL